MPLSVEKLRVLTFPQRIAGTQLDLNVLLVPTQRLLNEQDAFPSVRAPGTTVDLPRFIKADLALAVDAISGLGSYPFANPAHLTDGATLQTFATGAAFPASLPKLYEGLAAQFKLVAKGSFRNTEGAPVPLPKQDGIRKYLPNSYRTAFNFTSPRTPYAKTDDSYHCAIKRTAKPDPAFKQSCDRITWGRAIAFCLRQPQLAERIGLLHRLTVTLPSADYFADGGWVSCRLVSAAADFAIVDPATELRSYAARIPEITGPRPLFAALQFPVVDGPAQPNGDFDTLKIEAADYDDGFAKIVHAVQPVSSNLLAEAPDGMHPHRDIGVRLGWDDEQLLIWQNRQMLADPLTPGKRTDAPLGVFFHRVDVREPGDPDWHSLVRIRAKAALTLEGEAIASAGAEQETGVQVFPAKINADPDATYWLPSYFTQYYGASLVLPDATAASLDVTGALGDPGTYSDSRIAARPEQQGKGNLYDAVLDARTALRYGHEYEFRVRFGDLTGGGPLATEDAQYEAPATSASLVFKRYVAPKRLTVVPDEPQPDPGSVHFLAGRSFSVTRPRLGYPALLFTKLDTGVAVAKLQEDMAALHKNKPNGQNINEYREVGWFDPDVETMLVVVDVRTLALDNLGSASQRESYLRLYTTTRALPADPAATFTLELEYRDANVIDFGNEVDLGDLGISQAEIDGGDALVLPRSRDLRITVYPACRDDPAYFGFAPTRIAGELHRIGEAFEFCVREDAQDEVDFFRPGLESHQMQALYLQPDPPQVNNPLTLVTSIVAGAQAPRSTLLDRVAGQLAVDCKGHTLLGKPGERIVFGCSHRIRHTLAPDASSLTFATPDELLGHWLCVLSFEVGRDWTWDGLADAGIEVHRVRQFTGEAATVEKDVVGCVQWHRTASRTATTDPDRSRTRVVFVDAVEPKKDPSIAASPFPNTIDVAYTLTPTFIASVDVAAAAREAQARDVRLPVTTIPAQVPKIVAAGYALSPYQRNHGYSATAVRQRYLWLEFAEPIRDPHDTCFARILAYAPDPLLSNPNPDQVLVRQDDPPLAIDPELIRVVTHEHGNDNAGLDAMQPMLPETADPGAPLVKVTPVHYLLPLPPGLHAESPELFGFFTYELRVGHTDRIWCTAQGRFGHPARMSGIQHPAPPLKALAERTPGALRVTAPYATAVFDGRNVTSRPPKTELWCLLYAQVAQADGRAQRNLLLAEARLELVVRETVDIRGFLAKRGAMDARSANQVTVNLDAPATAACGWTEKELRQILALYDLAPGTSLSVVAVEMMPRYDRFVVFGDPPDTSVRPLSRDLGRYRILRTSPLVAAPEVCCEEC